MRIRFDRADNTLARGEGRVFLFPLTLVAVGVFLAAMLVPVNKPPTKSDLANLAKFLDAQPGMSLARAHGIMTAVASAPGMVMPSRWLSAATGDPEYESMVQAQKVSSSIMSLYNHTLKELNTGGLTLLGDDLAAWCRGYLAGVDLDQEWLGHNVGLQAIEPIRMAAAGSATPVPEKVVTEVVISTHLMFSAWRREQIAAGRVPGVPARSVPVRSGPKVGRNDPCPCGSGKKFKKCHGLEN